MTGGRRGHVRAGAAATGARAVVLALGLVAPAILAVGLLVGELTGYGTAPRPQSMPPARVAPANDVPAEIVPAERRRALRADKPDRLYRGRMPARQRVVSRHEAVQTVVVRRRPSARVHRVAERPPEEPGCPEEWRDTWLWELCRERGPA